MLRQRRIFLLIAEVETLRTQSRFHDPNGDSIFSWSDTTERYKAWTETHSRPGSGSNTPKDRHDHNVVSFDQTQAFCPPVKVLSSSPSATFTKNAQKFHVNEAGHLELMLPTMLTPVSTEGGKRRTRYTVLEYDPVSTFCIHYGLVSDIS